MPTATNRPQRRLRAATEEARAMTDLIFYTNPQSRGRIVRWMLEEVGEPYDTEIIDYSDLNSDNYRAVSPMAKVPAVRHDGHVVTDCAANCAYLEAGIPD